ncbi:unnamed protein product [Darwinula stevensoni]|uniref:Uncharacterized protein n=1 Tax=Darwinula stevensoni TaxID=69355 RepID=A0A7R8X1J8_9CRUS|nr:unnamed protein product [Darwinula stevensoni]CAG0880123.1 unnamed protein product [Darwinula stevensoni]
MEEIGLNGGAPSFSIVADNIRVCLCPGINCLCVKACTSCKSLIFDKWEPRPHVLSQRISVSLLGQHVAYAMTCENHELGMLCIVSSKDIREVVVRRVRGPICDLTFTRSAIDNLLAVIDAFGDVYVYEMGETKFGSLQVTNLLHISQSADFASYYHLLCWYADDYSKILLVTDDHNSQVWDIKSILEKQGQGSYFREDIGHSCVRLSHHSAPITCGVIAPEGKAVATVSLDGRLKVFFINLSFGQYSREMPCVQSWEPHKGKTLSSVHFLNKEAPRQFSYQWIIATACDQNSEIKIWSMETFTCLQVIRFRPSAGPLYQLKLEADLFINFLFFVDTTTSHCYILELEHEKEMIRAKSISSCALPFGILGYHVVDVRPSSNRIWARILGICKESICEFVVIAPRARMPEKFNIETSCDTDLDKVLRTVDRLLQAVERQRKALYTQKDWVSKGKQGMILKEWSSQLEQELAKLSRDPKQPISYNDFKLNTGGFMTCPHLRTWSSALISVILNNQDELKGAQEMQELQACVINHLNWQHTFLADVQVHEMTSLLKALYPLKQPPMKEGLKFSEGDLFLPVFSDPDSQWWNVLASDGSIGLIPSSYVISCDQIRQEDIVRFLDTAREGIQVRTVTRGGVFSKEQKNALAICDQMHDSLLGPNKDCSQDLGSSSGSSVPPLNLEMSTDRNFKDSPIEEEMVGAICQELVEAVRSQTHLSHKLSQAAVLVVTDILNHHLPKLHGDLTSLCECLRGSVSLLNTDEHVQETKDAFRLRDALKHLIEARYDEQQRSWALHEDEDDILKWISIIMDVMENADVKISRHILALDGFRYVADLVAYYQMEGRRTIRLSLLKTLMVLAAVVPAAIPTLVHSVLPLELARDIMSCGDDFERLNCSMELLTIILSLGTPLPCHYFGGQRLMGLLLVLKQKLVTHFVAHLQEQLNETFLEFLLSLVEPSPELGEDDVLSNTAFILLLALNLQFPSSSPSTNHLMTIISGQQDTPVLCEKLLYTFNREEEPLDLVEEAQKRDCSSVVKFLQDMFSQEHTAQFFYTNDVNVAIDILIRILNNLSNDDTRKASYLVFLHNVVKWTGYDEQRHRVSDVHSLLLAISKDEKSLTDVSFWASTILHFLPS